MTVEVTGFKTFTQTGISVVVGENERVDGQLSVGTADETVSISAEAITVDTESSTNGTTIDTQRIEEMPLNGRNVLALTQLVPGVGYTYFPIIEVGARGGPNFTVSGSPMNENNVELDGTTMVEQLINVSINLPNPDSLQEFRVLTDSYDAEYGRASGSVLLAVTKSGTNQFHGSLSEYIRNTKLTARNYFAPTTPFLVQNQYSGSVGGPVILPHYNGRDHSFFFFSYQGFRISQDIINAYFPPTQGETQGIIPLVTDPTTGKPIPLIDPATGNPFPNNTIPKNRFDPLSASLLNTYIPLPNAEPRPAVGMRSTLVADP